MKTDDVQKKKDMIYDDIVKALVEQLSISPTDISMDMRLQDDLIIDSFQTYEFVVDLEEAYDIRLPDELLDDVISLRDIIDLVYNLWADNKEQE